MRNDITSPENVQSEFAMDESTAAANEFEFLNGGFKRFSALDETFTAIYEKLDRLMEVIRRMVSFYSKFLDYDVNVYL